ncbi:MAG TPA: hypothetical protein VJ302_14660 [Blastocatellia bacterium]|nr:hypothetical protein [Blastocatellia bacterium]
MRSSIGTILIAIANSLLITIPALLTLGGICIWQRRIYTRKIDLYKSDLRHYQSKVDQHARKSRYADCLSRINQIIIDILRFQVKNASAAEIRRTCESLVNSLSQILRDTTGKECAVCIKILTYAQDEQPNDYRPKVITLCRDSASRSRERAAKHINHWTTKNTAFDTICKGSQPTFYSNDLPSLKAEGHYFNTSWGIQFKRPVDGGLDRLDSHWNLPYQSTIVAGIFSGPDDPGPDELVGFLCVDNAEINVFNLDYDIKLIESIANCLFCIVDRYTELKKLARNRNGAKS